MASLGYMAGRKKYGRPQALLFADNPGILLNGKIVPDGYEIESAYDGSDPALVNGFMILSDDNRAPIDFKSTRIENRQRMVNGRMRSHHIADKLTISTSWNLLPSRAFSQSPQFNVQTGKPIPNTSGSASAKDTIYTTDGGAGGEDLLSWYENHSGSFWVYLSYDKKHDFSVNGYARLGEYSQVVEVFISDFSYSVQKRGSSNFDLWSITLEEV
jgi:hypothetical protein